MSDQNRSAGIRFNDNGGASIMYNAHRNRRQTNGAHARKHSFGDCTIIKTHRRRRRRSEPRRIIRRRCLMGIAIILGLKMIS